MTDARKINLVAVIGKGGAPLDAQNTLQSELSDRGVAVLTRRAMEMPEGGILRISVLDGEIDQIKDALESTQVSMQKYSKEERPIARLLDSLAE